VPAAATIVLIVLGCAAAFLAWGPLQDPAGYRDSPVSRYLAFGVPWLVLAVASFVAALAAYQSVTATGLRRLRPSPCKRQYLPETRSHARRSLSPRSSEVTSSGLARMLAGLRDGSGRSEGRSHVERQHDALVVNAVDLRGVGEAVAWSRVETRPVQAPAEPALHDQDHGAGAEGRGPAGQDRDELQDEERARDGERAGEGEPPATRLTRSRRSIGAMIGGGGRR
jgi:hypothetical protein